MDMQDEEMRRGPWLEEEDEILVAAVARLGHKRWDALAKASGLKRTGKSCRLRWMNYLRPNVKHGQITEEEESLIIQLHQQWGNKWSKIARQLPGRTDNEIKNYWRSHLRKKATLVQEQEYLGSTTDNTEWNSPLSASSSISTPGCSSDDCTSEKPDFFGTFDISPDDNDEELLIKSTFSPYETRLAEWASCLANEPNGIAHHGDCCNLGLCYSSSSPWISEDNWESPFSIWNMH